MDDTAGQANYAVHLIKADASYSSLLYETRKQAERGYKTAITRNANGHYPGIVEIALYREGGIEEMLASTAQEQPA